MTKDSRQRFARAAGTGLCFIAFGTGGLLVGILVLPLLRLAPIGHVRRRDHTQALISRLCRYFIGMTRALGLLADRIEHADRLDHRGAVIVANHPSLIDVVLLLARLEQVDCIVKPSLRFNPATAIAVRMAGYITRAEGPTLVDRCCESLRNGRRLLLFPEGTRSVPGQQLKLERGAARIALAAGAPLVPVVIHIQPRVLTKRQRWYHAAARRVDVQIHVDEPFSVDAYLDSTHSTAVAARRLTRELGDYFRRRLTTADAPE
ncbi:1-acyl-sn-glycerol-3-phosphate acyltransferase [Salinisphaera sp. USBA-960]|nr:1-acyl-sn-glycerol-3-phosphate acyltransferase [Salifodinibacter halophilus]NNC25388.1 1-acyl-sn-glycerol-3-phosphate acyltransferase [Salifodinibacter halophilus]